MRGLMIDIERDKDEILHLIVASEKHHKECGSVSKMEWKPQDEKANLERLKSEFAVARVLGIEPFISRLIGKDPGYDGIYRRWTYEVKQTHHVGGALTYNSRKHTFNQDIWVLAITEKEGWKARVVGWVWRKEMPDLWQPCWFDQTAKCIEQEQLRPMSEMMDLPERGK